MKKRGNDEKKRDDVACKLPGSGGSCLPFCFCVSKIKYIPKLALKMQLWTRPRPLFPLQSWLPSFPHLPTSTFCLPPLLFQIAYLSLSQLRGSAQPGPLGTSSLLQSVCLSPHPSTLFPSHIYLPGQPTSRSPLESLLSLCGGLSKR